MADINDVYVWMEADTTKVNLAMTVSPGDPMTGRSFGPSVQYVFHVHSKAGLGVGMATVKETQIICTFASSTATQCWVKDNTGTLDYVSGDPSATAGITSRLGKFKVFAGRRTDPFFFNLQGFRNAVAAVKGAAGGITFDASGKCPNNLPDATVTAVRTILGTQQANDPTATPPCSGTNTDCFLPLRVKVIVVQIDKAVLNATGNNVIGVWASTHMGS